MEVKLLKSLFHPENRALEGFSNFPHHGVLQYCCPELENFSSYVRFGFGHFGLECNLQCLLDDIS